MLKRLLERLAPIPGADCYRDVFNLYELRFMPVPPQTFNPPRGHCDEAGQAGPKAKWGTVKIAQLRGRFFPHLVQQRRARQALMIEFFGVRPWPLTTARRFLLAFPASNTSGTPVPQTWSRPLSCQSVRVIR